MNRIIAKKSISADLVKFEIRTSIALNEIKVGQYVILIAKKIRQGIYSNTKMLQNNREISGSI